MAKEEAPKISPEAQALAAAIGQAIRENRQPGPFQSAGYSAEKIAELTEPPKPKRHRKVACRSEETGATFFACVVESKQFPAGRIISLEGYTHPKGIATYQSEGGLVPTGFQILKAGAASPEEGRAIPKHDFEINYLQWRWVEFWQKDLRKYAGKELKRHYAVSDEAFATPWLEGRTGPLVEDATP